VYLSAPNKDGKRLSNLFASVWKQLPLRDRRVILRHWKQRPEPISSTFVIAAELVSEWCDRSSEYLQTHGIVAQSREYGRKVFFRKEYFGDEAPSIDEDACYFIAHELAHVAWIARCEPAHIEAAATPSPDASSNEPDLVGEKCERLAEDLTAEWGVFSARSNRQGQIGQTWICTPLSRESGTLTCKTITVTAKHEPRPTFVRPR